MACLVASRPSASLPTMATAAPASANTVAISAPMPREAPVTRALLPCRLNRPARSSMGGSLGELTGREGIIHCYALSPLRVDLRLGPESDTKRGGGRAP